MKKLFLSILVICSLLGGNVFGAVVVVEKNSHVIIYKMSSKFTSTSKRKKNAREYCSSINKYFVQFWSSGSQQTVKPYWQRYYCVESIKELFENIDMYDNLLAPKYKFYGSGFVKLEGPGRHLKYDKIQHTNASSVPYKDYDQYLASLPKQKTTQSNTASSSSSSSSMNMKDKITQAKQICTDLGFQQKTEKHADCSMQMMSIQFETTNKVSSASGGTTQEVIVTHRNDYDIWDALLDFSAAIDPKNKTTTSSSSSNRGTNCVVGRTNPAFGTTTINCR